MSAQELESAVASLPPEELKSFRQWFDAFTLGLDCREDDREERLAELRAKLQVGIDELDRGEGIPWDLESFLAEARASRPARAGQ